MRLCLLQVSTRCLLCCRKIVYGTHHALHSFPTRRSSDLKVIFDTLDASLLLLPESFQTERWLGVHIPGLGAILTIVVRIAPRPGMRSEEHTSELQSRFDIVCRPLLEKKNH